MLRVSYFPNFKSQSDVVLFWGDREGVQALINIFAELLSGKDRHHFDDQDTQINAVLANDVCGMQRDGQSFRWTINRPTLADFHDLVVSLLEQDRPSHQYLRCNTHEITVMVSYNEYSSDFGAPEAAGVGRSADGVTRHHFLTERRITLR